jgi:hypothetical protein
MDLKRRPTDRELEELRSKVIASAGAITDGGRWMSVDANPKRYQCCQLKTGPRVCDSILL